MEQKNGNWMKENTMVVCAAIIAIGLILSGIIMASMLKNMPINGNGVVYSDPPSISYPAQESKYQLELIDMDGLLDYLRELYGIKEPMDMTYSAYEIDEEGNTTYSEETMKWKAERNQLKEEIKKNITEGTWKSFPYIKKGNKLYFRMPMVKEWFDRQSEKQFIID